MRSSTVCGCPLTLPAVCWWHVQAECRRLSVPRALLVDSKIRFWLHTAIRRAAVVAPFPGSDKERAQALFFTFRQRAMPGALAKRMQSCLTNGGQMTTDG